MKKRLDQLLVDNGYFPSRSKAQAAIMAGLIYIDGQKIEKAGAQVSLEALIEIKGEIHPFVSRGGVKIEQAIKEFNINVEGKIALDVGASTGGFTDCLLKHGTIHVYAIDVGYGQLDWKLRNDPRVSVVERTNIRYLTPEKLYEQKPKADLAVIDVSFISLSKVLPAVYNLLAERAEVIALIKPQFEARREQVGKGGIIKDENVHAEVIEKVKEAAKDIGFKFKGLINSPIEGADGNREFLIHLQKG